MKLSFTVETGEAPATPEVESSASWALVVDAWKKAGEATGQGQADRLQWVGGALAVHAVLTGGQAEALRDQLQREFPLQIQESPPGIVAIKPGRSTPPPPRSAGAQRPVEEPLDEDVGGVSTS